MTINDNRYLPLNPFSIFLSPHRSLAPSLPRPLVPLRSRPLVLMCHRAFVSSCLRAVVSSFPRSIVLPCSRLLTQSIYSLCKLLLDNVVIQRPTRNPGLSSISFSLSLSLLLSWQLAKCSWQTAIYFMKPVC